MSRLDYKGSQPIDASRTVFSVQTPSGTGCYTLIDKITSDGTFAYMDVEVPITYTDLICRVWGSVNTHSGATDVAYLQFNGDATAGNYRWTEAFIQNSANPLVVPEIAVTDDATGEPGISLPFTQFSGFDYPAAPGMCEVVVPEYANDGFWKIATGYGGSVVTTAAGAMFGGAQMLSSGQWTNTTPVSMVTVSCDPALWVSGTTFSVWGRC